MDIYPPVGRSCAAKGAFCPPTVATFPCSGRPGRSPAEAVDRFESSPASSLLSLPLGSSTTAAKLHLCGSIRAVASIAREPRAMPHTQSGVRI